MRTIALLFSLIVLAAPAHAAQRTLLEKKCHELVGNEEREGEGGAQPRRPVSSATLQRLHDGRAALVSPRHQFRAAAATTPGRQQTLHLDLSMRWRWAR